MRVVAIVAVMAMVVSLGYSALVLVQAPAWVILVVVALLIGVPIALFAGGPDRRA